MLDTRYSMLEKSCKTVKTDLLSNKRPPCKNSKSCHENPGNYIAPPIDRFFRKSQLIHITDFALAGRTFLGTQRHVHITKRTFFRRIIIIFFLVKTLVFRAHQSTLITSRKSYKSLNLYIFTEAW